MINIPVVQPFPWELLLAYLSMRSIPGLESIENNCFERVHEGSPIRVFYDQHQSLLQVQIESERQDQTEICSRVERLFSPGLSTAGIYAQLAESLPLSEPFTGFRPLGCWDPFELCVRTIVGQQVSVAAAQTIMHRLVDRCGVLTAVAVASADLEKIGMPERRVKTLHQLAQAVIDGSLEFTQPWDVLDCTLATISGIGPWTRGYLAIRLGRDADAFPETDVGLIRAARAENSMSLLHQAEQWRPFRAYAATCLWAMDSLQ